MDSLALRTCHDRQAPQVTFRPGCLADCWVCTDDGERAADLDSEADSAPKRSRPQQPGTRVRARPRSQRPQNLSHWHACAHRLLGMWRSQLSSEYTHAHTYNISQRERKKERSSGQLSARMGGPGSEQPPGRVCPLKMWQVESSGEIPGSERFADPSV